MRTSLRKTSLKCDAPVGCTSGRTSTPGLSIGTMMNVMPWCFGTSGLVRVSSIPQLQNWAAEFQTFWPVTTNSSPSRTARHARLARSEPAPGSLNSWETEISPDNIFGMKYALCSSEACFIRVGRSIAMVAAMKPTLTS